MVTLDGRPLHSGPITKPASSGEVVKLVVECTEGRHEFGFDFPNDYWRPDAKDPNDRDRNLLLDWIEITGPLDAVKAPIESAWILAADPGRGSLSERVRPVAREVLRRVWRRPPSPQEIEQFVALVADNAVPAESLSSSLSIGLEAALISSHFLFRAEPGSGPTGPSQQTLAPQAPNSQALDSWALATQLAFFLWSSTPDLALLEVAAAGGLQDTASLGVQTRRMLADERANALACNFAAQWLELRQLDLVTPDKKRFPTWTRELRHDMRGETEELFLAVLREQRDVRDLVDPPFTFLNERLATHYGIAGVKGTELRKVELTDRRFGGLLAQASILTVTSNPTRTSPVKRGKWVLENILDQAPPPPPPGNDSFKSEQLVQDTKSMRVQMAIHRRDAACATCHVRMDALGLALESFDPIGRWRTQDGGEPVDTSGALPGGRRLSGIDDLKRLLSADPAFVRCLLEKLFVYAVGRGPGTDDELLLDAIATSLLQERVPTVNLTLTDMILAIVTSDPFRLRRPNPTK